ncbi:MAG: hypothetical protein IJQ76_01690 [Prevotella sp.]|nr:hypothetical protein [Prevotella sp.]
MKKLFTMAAGLLLAATASAQGQFPTEYSGCLQSFGFNTEICGVWDEIVQGKPGQGLGLMAPGAKMVKTHLDAQDFSLPDEVHEFYPNGLLKAKRQEGGVQPESNFSYTYHYDKQWRLQNVTDKDGKVVFKYYYDEQGRLIKTVSDRGTYNEYTYNYDQQGLLKQVNHDNRQYFDYDKNGNMVKMHEKVDWESYPNNLKYDQQGRWKGYSQIVLDGMDELFYTKVELTVNYLNGPLPTSMTFRTGECNPKTNAYKGKPETYTNRCTYQYDSHKNWTSWKATGGYPTWTITRTISYYTDEEVKEALSQMEQARKPAEKQEQKEDLWEF